MDVRTNDVYVLTDPRAIERDPDAVLKITGRNCVKYCARCAVFGCDKRSRRFRMKCKRFEPEHGKRCVFVEEA